MCSLLAKRISSHFFSPSPLLHHRCLYLLTPLQRYYLSHQPRQENELPFVAQYFISSFAINPHHAIKLSGDRRLNAIKSLERPNAVVQFLKETGLSDALIKSTLLYFPALLAYNVENTLKPKIRQLTDAGFSQELLVQLISLCPTVLVMKDPLPRLQFWKDCLGKSEETFLKFIKNNRFLVLFDIDKQVVPRMNLFREYGLSDPDIMGLFLHEGFMGRSVDVLRQLLELIEELGIKRGCKMYLRAVKELGRSNIDKMKRNAELYQKEFGWSKDELCLAFRTFPVILRLSFDSIKLHMNFLVREAKLDPRTIAYRPTLLGYSIEKRLVPRHHVLSILVAKGLQKTCTLTNACQYSEKRFLEKYIEPYKKDVPELGDVYLAAFGGSCVK